MKQILIFGDSVMRGVYYSEEAGRHKLYKDRFAKLKDSGYEVTNCSIMGATVKTGEDIIKKRLTTRVSDTTVIFEYGGNDCDYRWNEISEAPKEEHLPNTPISSYVPVYKKLIAYAREAGAKVCVCNLVPLDSEKYMNWISRNLSYDNILSWLGDSSTLYRWQEYYSHTAEKIAAETECPIIDIRRPFLISHNYGELLSDDGIHPSIKGHALIDELITETIS